MPHLIVVADGGLGNRLWPIVSALSMRTSLPKYTVNVLWIKNQSCDITCNDLFNDNIVSTINLEEVITIKPWFGIELITHKKHYCNNLVNRGISGRFKLQPHIVDALLQKEKDLIIDTPHALQSHYVNRELFPVIFRSILKGSVYTNIMDTIQTLKLDSSCVGCHLRGTDNPESSPNQIQQTVNRIKKNSDNHRFFVCSDMKEIETQFKETPHVVMYDKTAYVTKKDPRHRKGFVQNVMRSADSVLQSLTDICCLSLCDTSREEYHTYKVSTFLAISRAIRGWEHCDYTTPTEKTTIDTFE